jgi:hypothetical protein
MPPHGLDLSLQIEPALQRSAVTANEEIGRPDHGCCHDPTLLLIRGEIDVLVALAGMPDPASSQP